MTMRIVAAALVVSAVAVVGCQQAQNKSAPADTLASVKAAGVVRVGVKSDAPPFGWKDDFGYNGFDVDIANAVAEELGIAKVEFVTVTSADRLDKVAAGDVDFAIASMTITRTREAKVDFTIPYFQDGQGLLVRSDSSIVSYEDLAGKTVAAARGATSIQTITQFQPDCSVKEFDGYQSALAALRDGSVDALTSDMLILLGLKLDAEDSDAFRIAGERFSTEPYGIAVAENQSKWRDAINDAIQKLWENGRWQRIFEGWFGENAKYFTDVAFVIVPYPR